MESKGFKPPFSFPRSVIASSLPELFVMALQCSLLGSLPGIFFTPDTDTGRNGNRLFVKPLHWESFIALFERNIAGKCTAVEIRLVPTLGGLLRGWVISGKHRRPLFSEFKNTKPPVFRLTLPRWCRLRTATLITAHTHELQLNILGALTSAVLPDVHLGGRCYVQELPLGH